jgi:sulfur-oxidizing protein SoxZ
MTMAEVKARVRVPEVAKKGELIEIKTLISHPMETGQRIDENGEKVPRNIIKKFTCTYGGEAVFEADWFPSVSANPYLAFTMVATESGEVVFTWVDDDERAFVATARLEVE